MNLLKMPDPAQEFLAHDCAKDIYKTIRQTATHSSTVDRLVMDLSALIVEIFDCISTNQGVSTEIFERISIYSKYNSKSPLLKLGFSLRILLQRLVADRYEVTPTYSGPPRQPDLFDDEEVGDYEECIWRNISQRKAEKVDINVGPVAEPLLFERPSGSGTMKEVKEEPVEVKEEPLDDHFFDDEAFTEAKEEPIEPIVDVFCPTTGTARPLEEADVFVRSRANKRRLIEEEVDEDDSGHFPSVEEEKRLNTLLSPRLVKKDPTLASIRSIMPAAALNSKFPANIENPLAKECYLCGAFTEKFYGMPIQHKRRGLFLTEIITKSDMDNAKVAALRTSSEDAYFCQSHFFVVEPKKKKMEEGDCELCKEPQYPCIMSPKHNNRQKDFWENLITLNPEDKNKICELWATNKRVNICSKHFKKENNKKSKVKTPSLIEKAHSASKYSYSGNLLKIKRKKAKAFDPSFPGPSKKK